MFDPPVFLLLHQIGVDTVLFVIQIGVDIHLADIVHKIEVKILHLQFLKLSLEYLLHLVPIRRVIAGELGRDIKAVPRISR